MKLYKLSNNIITEFQFGFKKGENTTDVISTLLAQYEQNFDEGSVTQGVFSNFSIVFDNTDLEILIKIIAILQIW